MTPSPSPVGPARPQRFLSEIMLRVRSRLHLALALGLASSVLAGCGGSSPSSAATGAAADHSKRYVDALHFSICMRAHGVSDFPDPDPSSGWSGSALSRIDTSAPAFNTATSRCDRLLPNSGQPTPAQFEATLVDGTKVAKCMRAHGVYMPDPGVQGDHLTIDMSHMNPGETTTPQFRRVGDLCDKKVFGYP